MTERGKSHEMEPDAGSLSYVGFEEPEAEDGPPEDEGARRAWMVDAARDVLASANYDVRDEDLSDTLYVELDLRGEEALWSLVEDYCHAHGFDTYNSDSRFELYPGGTPPDPMSSSPLHDATVASVEVVEDDRSEAERLRDAASSLEDTPDVLGRDGHIVITRRDGLIDAVGVYVPGYGVVDVAYVVEELDKYGRPVG